MITKKQKELLKNLVSSAIEGKLSLENLHKTWPEEFENNSNLDLIFDDIEGAVEHLPGKIFSNEIDWKNWRRNDYYLKLKIDLELIDLIDNEKFIKQRNLRIKM